MTKLYVVGIGPGAYEDMTIRGARVLGEVDVIAGYHVYVDLVKEHFSEKEFLTTPMMQEEKRCQMALDLAQEGKSVAMISSGDAGIYGMAGLIFQMAHAGGDRYREVDVEVIPGITAASSGAALLGAPLMHDFAVISLSDLMTPWEKIAARIDHAAQADLGMVLYNPSSKKRADYLQRACDIILQHVPGSRVCGLASNIGREGASARVLTLQELRDTKVDMFTTVFIGNAQTVCMEQIMCKEQSMSSVQNTAMVQRMVTPRGYQI